MSSKDKPKALLAWSSGKDSAWTLHSLRQSDEYELVGLLTTFNEAFDRVAMHAVRSELVEAQAQAVGLGLSRVQIPWPCSNKEYEQAMADALNRAKQEQGVTHVAFGDLYLEDIRAYREEKLQGTGITPIFPIWHQPTDRLSREMVQSGLRAIITCIDPKKLSSDFVGRTYDETFLDDLPDEIDPCGENGEFHSYAYSGPMFNESISIAVGEVVERDGFVFADLIPK